MSELMVPPEVLEEAAKYEKKVEEQVKNPGQPEDVVAPDQTAENGTETEVTAVQSSQELTASEVLPDEAGKSDKETQAGTTSPESAAAPAKVESEQREEQLEINYTFLSGYANNIDRQLARDDFDPERVKDAFLQLAQALEWQGDKIKTAKQESDELVRICALCLHEPMRRKGLQLWEEYRSQRWSQEKVPQAA